jgi:hypothetical protein
MQLTRWIRDDHRRFVLAKSKWISPIMNVAAGEAIGLLIALNRAKDLHLYDINFEIDCKRVVNSLYSKKNYASELGAVTNSHVKFIRR